MAGYESIPSPQDLSCDPPLQLSAEQQQSTTTRQWAKIAGVLYVVVIVAGLTAEVGLRGNVLSSLESSIPETGENIAQRGYLLRWALMTEVVMSASDIVIALLLFAILVTSGASPLWTGAAMAFRILQQAILSTNLLHMFAANLLLDESLPVLRSMAGDDAEALAHFFLVLHKYGYELALIFFGLSLTGTGAVVLRWPVFPMWLGVALFLAGLGYVIDSTLFFLQVGYDGQASGVLMLPVFVAEFGLAGWLLACQPRKV